MRRVAGPVAFGEDGVRIFDERCKPCVAPRAGQGTQFGGTALDRLALDLRHAGGRRAGAGRIGKDVTMHDAEFADNGQVGSVMVLGFGGETGNEIRADGAIGAQVLEPRNEVYRIAAQVPALHALQNEIVTVLQREVKMRHETLFMGEQFEQSDFGRQELGGEMIAAVEGALWSRALIERYRHMGAVPQARRVIVAVDPPASSSGDACGIVVAMLGGMLIVRLFEPQR